MRLLIIAAVLGASGCATPQGVGSCAALRSSAGFDAIDRYTGELQRLGNALHGQWVVCGQSADHLAAFEADIRARNLRVNHEARPGGGCALIPVTLKPTGAEVRRASDLVCRVAGLHGVTFQSWGGSVADRYIMVTPRSWSDHPADARRFRSS